MHVFSHLIKTQTPYLKNKAGVTAYFPVNSLNTVCGTQPRAHHFLSFQMGQICEQE